MPKYIEMPKLSDTMSEGTLLKWRKKEGDKVSQGDVLAEVETDKATMEMEAFDDGILHQFLVKEGTKVAIGTRLAMLLGKGEQPPADGAAPAEAAKTPAASKPKDGAPAPAPVSPAAPAAAAKATAVSGERVKVSPLAKKIAASKGVDLSGVSGTGPGGRIVAQDVEAAPAGGTRAAAASAPAIPSMPAGAGDQRIALSGMRRVIAERLLASKDAATAFLSSTSKWTPVP
jgi:pyruvate dehydrogenase E2 component (dihydrolipoamide acetyltransferase)